MKPIIALVAAGLLTTAGVAAPCRDGKGHFAKCNAPGAKPLGAAAATGNVSRDKNGKCHIITPAPGQKKGQFIPCPK